MCITAGAPRGGVQRKTTCCCSNSYYGRGVPGGRHSGSVVSNREQVSSAACHCWPRACFLRACTGHQRRHPARCGSSSVERLSLLRTVSCYMSRLLHTNAGKGSQLSPPPSLPVLHILRNHPLPYAGASYSYDPQQQPFWQAMEVRAFGLMLRDVAERCDEEPADGMGRQAGRGASVAAALRTLAERCAELPPKRRPSFQQVCEALKDL